MTQPINDTAIKVNAETIPEWAERIACRHNHDTITLYFRFQPKYFSDGSSAEYAVVVCPSAHHS